MKIMTNQINKTFLYTYRDNYKQKQKIKNQHRSFYNLNPNY